MEGQGPCAEPSSQSSIRRKRISEFDNLMAADLAKDETISFQLRFLVKDTPRMFSIEGLVDCYFRIEHYCWKVVV